MTANESGIPSIARLPAELKPRYREDLVRLGSRHDGGYVITESIIRNTDFVVGLGVGRDWSFEEEFNRRKRCPVHCYDHTISLGRFTRDSIRHTLGIIRFQRLRNIGRLSEPVNLLPLKYSSFFRGKIKHYKEKIGADAESETGFRRIFSRVPDGDGVFVKIDIEGAEYQALSGLGDFYRRVTGLVVEFHHVIFLRDRLRSHISELLHSFDIVHVHVNNTKGVDDHGTPDVIEVTFENKNLRNGVDKESEREYPIDGLDYPNCLEYADFQIIFASGIWNGGVRTSSS